MSSRPASQSPSTARWLVHYWTVDYNDGQGPAEITVPHSWQQDVSVEFEGPVIYRTVLELSLESAWLVFRGVSYAATVFFDGEKVAFHTGTWDAFSVRLPSTSQVRTLSVEVHVTKSGGTSYPVGDVVSGFIPYLFQTFGGIYREVEVVESVTDPLTTDNIPNSRSLVVEGKNIRFNGSPLFLRGILHWGWYPEVGHPNPSEEIILAELAAIKEYGFNCVKFCLWVPPHRYLELLEQFDMFAWIELPLWNPNPDMVAASELEIERIVRQYRHHSRIIAWTVGCELGNAMSFEQKSHLFETVKSLTGCPLVRDDSGGIEFFGGDPRGNATFEDFHPYCDLPFFPLVLNSLVPTARKTGPVFLGEFDDIDIHRDLERLSDEQPFWTSALSELNAKGVRWQNELPEVIGQSRFAHEPRDSGHHDLMRSSISKATFMRKEVQEFVRGLGLSGYVVTGLRDTPITSSGFFDDWGMARFPHDQVLAWNDKTCLFQIPQPVFPFVHRGNRPSQKDLANILPGPHIWKIGVHSESGFHAGGLWRITDGTKIVARGTFEPQTVTSCEATEIGTIFFEATTPGEYRLEVEFGPARNHWPVEVLPNTDPSVLKGTIHVPEQIHAAIHSPSKEWAHLLRPGLPIDWGQTEHPNVTVLDGIGTISAPFWRESAYQFADDPAWAIFDLRDCWHRLYPLSADCCLDPAWLDETFPHGWRSVVTRIDTRTYRENPVLVRAGSHILTTVRPYGGLGSIPLGLNHNPAGMRFLASLLSSGE